MEGSRLRERGQEGSRRESPKSRGQPPTQVPLEIDTPAWVPRAPGWGLRRAPLANGAGHGQVEQQVDDAIPVATGHAVWGAQVRVPLWGAESARSDGRVAGQGLPRLQPTYPLGVEVHEAPQVAVLPERDEQVHHGREGEDSKHYG